MEGVKNGKIRHYFFCFALLALIPLIEFLFKLITNFIVAEIGGVGDGSYYVHIILVNFLNTFLLGVLANTLGFCLALRFKRVASYSIFAFVIFIISSMSDMLPGNATNMTGINFWPFKEIFSYILPPNMNSVLDYQYGLFIEQYRWNLMLFWIFFLFFIAFFAFIKKGERKKFVVSVAAFLLAALNLFGYFLGGSDFNRSMSPDSIDFNDYFYYRNHEQFERKADFRVTSYNMCLNIDRQLDSRVEMAVDNSTLDKFEFTLYHGYKVKKVYDGGGDSLEFNRSSDYITVYPNRKPVDSIVIEYSGYTPALYSNSQAALLPGCFPYYPMPGFYKVHSGNNVGYTPIASEASTEFEFKVNSCRQIFSNLPEVENENNIFKGKSDCVTVSSGFLFDNSCNGYDICAISIPGWGFEPLDSEYLDKIQTKITELEKENGIKDGINLKDKKIFQSSNSFINFAYYDIVQEFDDHIFIGGGIWVDDIADKLVMEEKNAEN